VSTYKLIDSLSYRTLWSASCDKTQLICAAGQRGPRGSPGPPGRRGDTGDDGDTGVTGMTGSTGPSGHLPVLHSVSKRETSCQGFPGPRGRPRFGTSSIL